MRPLPGVRLDGPRCRGRRRATTGGRAVGLSEAAGDTGQGPRPRRVELREQQVWDVAPGVTARGRGGAAEGTQVLGKGQVLARVPMCGVQPRPGRQRVGPRPRPRSAGLGRASASPPSSSNFACCARRTRRPGSSRSPAPLARAPLGRGLRTYLPAAAVLVLRPPPPSFKLQLRSGD